MKIQINKSKKNTEDYVYTRCPRCGAKVISKKFCTNCELVFDRLKYASNKEAKKNIKARNRDYVIYTDKFPSDLSKKKTVLLCVFLGFFGAHNIYVGKYIRGIINFFAMLLAILATALPVSAFNAAYNIFLSICMPFVSVASVLWFFDLIGLVFGKFKVPISLKLDNIKG